MIRKTVLIFDFDATFYSGKDVYCNVDKYVNKNRRKFLPNITDEQYDDICKKEPYWLEQISGKDIVNALYKLKSKYPNYKIDTSAFWQCQQDEIYNINLVGAQKVDSKFIKKLCEEYPCYIVSNSSPNHIHHYMKKININPSWFVEVISNHFIEEDPTKEHYYAEIAQKENIKPENMLVFGDSESSDLVPARNIGAKTFLIKNANDINKIVLTALKTEENEFMEKQNLLKEWMNAKMSYEGYSNIRNPKYDSKYGEELRKKEESLKNKLLLQGYTEKELDITFLEEKKEELDMLR